MRPEPDGQIQWSGWEMSSHSEQQNILHGGLGLWGKEKHRNEVIRCYYLIEKKMQYLDLRGKCKGK